MSITVSSVSPEKVLWIRGGNKEIGFSRFKLQLSGRRGEISKKVLFTSNTRTAVVYLNFRAGSTFPVPVCTVSPGQWVNKADTK